MKINYNHLHILLKIIQEKLFFLKQLAKKYLKSSSQTKNIHLIFKLCKVFIKITMIAIKFSKMIKKFKGLTIFKMMITKKLRVL